MRDKKFSIRLTFLFCDPQISGNKFNNDGKY